MNDVIRRGGGEYFEVATIPECGGNATSHATFLNTTVTNVRSVTRIWYFAVKHTHRKMQGRILGTKQKCILVIPIVFFSYVFFRYSTGVLLCTSKVTKGSPLVRQPEITYDFQNFETGNTYI